MQYAIGIDPGINTGVAVWDRNKKTFIHIVTTDFWGTIIMIQTKFPYEKTSIYIEDPGANKPVFIRDANQQATLRIAQNVGSNKRDAILLIEGFKRFGYKVHAVPPRKGSRTKMKMDEFARLTGYDGKHISQHARDAAMLVWGR